MIFELAHQMALVPIAAMMVAGRRLSASYWLVALAFLMSWFADSFDHYSGGLWSDVWVWLLFQFLLVVAAVTRGRTRLLWMAAVGLVGSLSLILTPGPDWLLTLAGSAAVLMLARGWLTIPLALYFGAGTFAYFWMIASIGGDILPAWYVYQGCRVAAYGAFVGLILLHWTGATHGLDDGGTAGPVDRPGPATGGEALARPAVRYHRRREMEG